MGLFNFLVGLMAPTRLSTRAYMVQQLVHFGVPKGRLSKACVKELTEGAVRTAKLLAHAKRQHWLELATDHIEGTAVNVADFLEGEQPDSRFPSPVHEILVKHGALPLRVPVQNARTANFDEVMQRARALKGRERSAFSTTIFVISQAYIAEFGGHEGFAAQSPAAKRQAFKANWEMELHAWSQAKNEPIAAAAALARRAHGHLLAAIMNNEGSCVNKITAELGPFIDDGAALVSVFRSIDDNATAT